MSSSTASSQLFCRLLGIHYTYIRILQHIPISSCVLFLILHFFTSFLSIRLFYKYPISLIFWPALFTLVLNLNIMFHNFHCIFFIWLNSPHSSVHARILLIIAISMLNQITKSGFHRFFFYSVGCMFPLWFLIFIYYIFY
jgi:hypothetical protein